MKCDGKSAVDECLAAALPDPTHTRGTITTMNTHGCHHRSQFVTQKENHLPANQCTISVADEPLPCPSVSSPLSTVSDEVAVKLAEEDESVESDQDDAHIAAVQLVTPVPLPVPPSDAMGEPVTVPAASGKSKQRIDKESRMGKATTLASAKPTTVTTRPALGLRICWLPVDALHCIASFLTAPEWANFGQTTKVATPICRSVFHRVRMHAFRCASEVVTAWKLGQHADARELAALYIKAGVPIYPLSLGHSYHTMVWRMKVEAKEMAHVNHTNKDDASSDAEVAENQNIETNSTEQTDSGHVEPVDAFFVDRYVRAQDGNVRSSTYLEEKCLYKFDKACEKDSRYGSRLSLTSRANFAPPTPVLNNSVQGLDGWARLPEFRAVSSHDSHSPSSLRSSPSNQHRPAAPKVPIKVHRHLVNQHLMGFATVDDENGGLVTAPVSLAADYFHQDVGPHRLIGGIFGTDDSSHLDSRSGSPQQKSEARPGDTLPRTPVVSSPVSFQEAPSASNPDLSSRRTSHGAERSNGEARIPIDEPYPFRSHQMSTPESTQLSRANVDPFLSFDSQHQLASASLFPSHSPPPPVPTPDELSPTDIPKEDVAFFSRFDLEIYTSESGHNDGGTSQRAVSSELKSHLKTRFGVYERRLETHLQHNDSPCFEECLLDFWDEFLPITANIHYYDRHTAIPRISGLQKFLNKPCPKAIGTIQCEIERIRVNPKKGVNMKRRLFPTYEYRLFIRDRRHTNQPESAGNDEELPHRRDTVLMMAKNRGRKHKEESGIAASKKGVNNYYLYTPQQNDVDTHYRSVNDSKDAELIPNGASSELPTRTCDKNAQHLLGRLQSNFIGTEFQIFTPTIQKRSPRKPKPVVSRSLHALSSDSGSDVAYDSATSSENAAGSSSKRRNRFKRRGSSNPVFVRSSKRGADTSAASFCQPQPIEEEENMSQDTHEEGRTSKRSYSLPSFSYRRSSRSSRRAVANAVDSTEAQVDKAVVLEEEDGAITYTANLLGNRPRIMDVCVPMVSSDGSAGAEWKKFLETAEDLGEASNSKMLAHFKQVLARRDNPDQNQEDDEETDDSDFGLLALQNRPPWWNMELNAFVLNFGGRVSVASVKNFQLCDRSQQDHVMLQFGRIGGRHAFTMDFQHPLTAVQAFAIAISSLQSRISFG